MSDEPIATTEAPRVLDLRAVADRTGLTLTAVRRRVERGSLPSLVRNGRRVVPASAVEALVQERGTPLPPEVQGNPTGYHAATIDLSELVSQIVELSQQVAVKGLLAAQAESSRAALETEVFQLRSELELAKQQLTQKRRWFRRG